MKWVEVGLVLWLARHVSGARSPNESPNEKKECERVRQPQPRPIGTWNQKEPEEKESDKDQDGDRKSNDPSPLFASASSNARAGSENAARDSDRRSGNRDDPNHRFGRHVTSPEQHADFAPDILVSVDGTARKTLATPYRPSPPRRSERSPPSYVFSCRPSG